MINQKKVSILQSNYIPWKGYFDIIKKSDVFIFHDDLQYTKGDWRNRNKIKTSNGVEWITIPCGTNEKRLICEVELTDYSWQKKHWDKICMFYNKAKYFKEFKFFFEEFYLGYRWRSLSELNQKFIKDISKEIFKFETKFEDSRMYDLKLSKSDRVVELLKKAGATTYLSGPSAINYLNEGVLSKINVKLEWMNYDFYPVYTQLYPPFDHCVSILDLIFNMGDDSLNYF